MENQTKPTSENTTKKLVNAFTKIPQATAAKSLEHASNVSAKSVELAKKPVYHIRNSQIATGIIGTTGLIIFALGVENLITNTLKVSSPFVEIIFGFILLSISGLLLKKLI